MKKKSKIPLISCILGCLATIIQFTFFCCFPAYLFALFAIVLGIIGLKDDEGLSIVGISTGSFVILFAPLVLS